VRTECDHLNWPPFGPVSSRISAPLGGDLAQLEIRRDPVGRLPAAMPGTITAAGQLHRSGCPPAIRRQVGDPLPTDRHLPGSARPGRPGSKAGDSGPHLASPVPGYHRRPFGHGARDQRHYGPVPGRRDADRQHGPDRWRQR
jgi:hypothetical protein